MSISSQIQLLNTNLENAYATVSAKGGTVPQNACFNNLSTSISSIPSGGGSSYIVPNCELVSPWSDKIVYDITNSQVSGFSSSDAYLYLSEKLPPKTDYTSFEFLFTMKVDFSALYGNNIEILFSTKAVQGLDMEVDKDGHILFSQGDGTQWNVSDIASINAVQSNTFYNIKLKFDGNKYTVEVSDDFTNYSEWIRVDSTEYPGESLIGTSQEELIIQLGTSRLNETSFFHTDNLVFDLSKTYLKLDNVLYWSGLTNYTPLVDDVIKSLGYEVPAS